MGQFSHPTSRHLTIAMHIIVLLNDMTFFQGVLSHFMDYHRKFNLLALSGFIWQDVEIDGLSLSIGQSGGSQETSNSAVRNKRC